MAFLKSAFEFFIKYGCVAWIIYLIIFVLFAVLTAKRKMTKGIASIIYAILIIPLIALGIFILILFGEGRSYTNILLAIFGIPVLLIIFFVTKIYKSNFKKKDNSSSDSEVIDK